MTQLCDPGHCADDVQQPLMATQRLPVHVWQAPHCALLVQHPLTATQLLERQTEHAPGHWASDVQQPLIARQRRLLPLPWHDWQDPH